MHFLAVNFHYISDINFPYPGIYPVTPDAFEYQLDILGANFKFVALSDIDAHLKQDRFLPEFACIITFDDGLLEQFQYAWPILKRKGIPAAFFVNTVPVLSETVSLVHKIHWLRSHILPQKFLNDLIDICAQEKIPLESINLSENLLAQQYRYDLPEVQKIKYILNFGLGKDQQERVISVYFNQQFGDESKLASRLYMIPEQWRILAEAGCLGSHSCRHLPLAQLTYTEMLAELKQSIIDLQTHTGIFPFAVSYPYGGPSAVSLDVATIAEQAGFRFGFSMERAFNRTMEIPLLMARGDTNDVPGGKHPRFEIDNGNLRMLEGFNLCRSRWFKENGH